MVGEATARFGDLQDEAEASIPLGKAVDSLGLEQLPAILELVRVTRAVPDDIDDRAAEAGMSPGELFGVASRSKVDPADIAAFVRSSGDTVRDAESKVDPATVEVAYPRWAEKVRDHLALSRNESIAAVVAYLARNELSVGDLLAMPKQEAREAMRMSVLAWRIWRTSGGAVSSGSPGNRSSRTWPRSPRSTTEPCPVC